jgi:dTDP-4-dehydrorhamnose reductase
VFVLGAGGYLGSNLVRALTPRFGVIAVGRAAARTPATAPFADWVAALDEVRANDAVLVVNTIAIADIARCEADPVAADDVNHAIARDVAAACAQRRVPLVHVSTDGLFGHGTSAGAPAYFRPSDPTHEINVYARSKRHAERALERLDWGAVLRLSFVGPDNGTGRGLIRYLADCARNIRPEAPGFIDNWFTPVHVDDVADAIAAIAGHPASGFTIRHIASYPAMTKFDYLQHVLRASAIGLRVVPVIGRTPGGTAPYDQSLAADAPIPIERVIAASANDLRSMLALVGR